MTKKPKRDGKVVHLSTEYHAKLRRYAEGVGTSMALIIYELIDERIAADGRQEHSLPRLPAVPVVKIPVEKKPKAEKIEVPVEVAGDPPDALSRPPFWKQPA